MKSRWLPYRAVFINYWNFDEQEFYFKDGKLFVRGANGSGKSVTTISIAPLLLDGCTRPERLDPFGSRARTLKESLLGDNYPENEEKTGYVFLEYKREDSEEYVTTGIGIQFNGKNDTNTWYFVVENKRIGYDFSLTRVDKALGDKVVIPLNKTELESAIGRNGTVLDKDDAYAEKVNKTLFGFKEQETFNELVKLLLQLRGAKLNKDVKPATIYEILTNSLPELTADDFDPLSSTIDQIDSIRNVLEELKREYTLTQGLTSKYQVYNEVILCEKASELLAEDKNLAKENVNLRTQQKTLEEKKQELTQKESELKTLSDEAIVVRENLQVLESNKELSEIQEKITSVKKTLEESRQAQGQKNKSLDGYQKREMSLKETIKAITTNQDQSEKEAEAILDDLEGLSQDSGFAAQHESESSFLSRSQDKHLKVSAWLDTAKKYNNRLRSVSDGLTKLDNLKEKKTEKDREQGETKFQIEEITKAKQQEEDALIKAKEQLETEIIEWQKDTQELILGDQIEGVLESLWNAYDYDNITADDYRQEIERITSSLREALKDLEISKKNAVDQKGTELKAKEKELSECKAIADPEPPRSPETNKRRAELKARIPFIPFYNAVEFKENVDDALKATIESAIKEIGLLDALITSKDYRGELSQHDRIVIPKPVALRKTLADYLYATPIKGIGVSAGDIEAVLQSIVVNSDSMQGGIGEDGSYQIGIMKGSLLTSEKSVFIGKEQRRLYRETLIKNLEQERDDLFDELGTLEIEYRKLKARVNTLDVEKQKIPQGNVLRQINEKVQRKRVELESAKTRSEQQLDQLNAIQRSIISLNGALVEESNGITIPLKREAYDLALTDMESYLDKLNKLSNVYYQLHSLLGQFTLANEQYEQAKELVDDTKGELADLESKIERNQKLLTMYEAQLINLGAEDIWKQIEVLHNRLNVIPGLEKKLNGESGSLVSEIKALEETISKTHTKVEFLTRLVSYWKDVFVADYELGLVDASPLGWDVLVKAKQIKATYGSLASSSNRDQAFNGFNDKYQMSKNDLLEYSPELKLADYESPEETEDELFKAKLETLTAKAKRWLVTAKYEWQTVNPILLEQKLKDKIKAQESLISDEQKNLYEKILIDNLGEKIRNKIAMVRSMVDDMNTLMSEGSFSSNLKFRLEWNPNPAQNEDELSTAEIVRFLQMKASLLKDEDKIRFVQHFMAKIEKAKRSAEDESNRQGLHSSIRQALDYRQWYSFRLTYEKDNHAPLELTANRFAKLSGGERALAMYIPLFTAIYSKYQKANEDAPRLVALDEAFAGIDDKNIEDTYRIVEELGFSYIMNSQVLWGCYPTVKSLSIYQLFKGANADFVAAVHYTWNGSRKSRETDEYDPVNEEDVS